MPTFDSHTSRYAGKIGRILTSTGNFVRHLVMVYEEIVAIFSNHIKSIVENAAMRLESKALKSYRNPMELWSN